MYLCHILRFFLFLLPFVFTSLPAFYMIVPDSSLTGVISFNVHHSPRMEICMILVLAMPLTECLDFAKPCFRHEIHSFADITEIRFQNQETHSSLSFTRTDFNSHSFTSIQQLQCFDHGFVNNVHFHFCVADGRSWF